MKIYTKKGDRGETGLFGGKRVPKDDLRLEAYGAVDELNSFVGSVRALRPRKVIDILLTDIQNDLFVLGADLAAPDRSRHRDVPRIAKKHSAALEKAIDTIEPSLRPLRFFVLPGGTRVGAQLQVARAVCRRAERSIVRLARAESVGDDVLRYINRLSDLLFVLARYANHLTKTGETRWAHPTSKR